MVLARARVGYGIITILYYTILTVQGMNASLRLVK